MTGGEPNSMPDTGNNILMRMVADISALKRDAEVWGKSSATNQAKIEQVERSLSEVHRKLDRMIDTMGAHENRLTKTEEGVEDWKRVKNRLLSSALGFGVGAGGAGGLAGAWFAKLLGGQS